MDETLSNLMQMVYLCAEIAKSTVVSELPTTYVTHDQTDDTLADRVVIMSATKNPVWYWYHRTEQLRLIQ